MMKNYFLLLILFSAFFYACPDDPQEELPDIFENEFQIDIVTGINARDFNGAPIGVYGNPNTSFGLVEAYPNPAIDALAVQYIGQDRTITNCWLFPATRDTTYADVDYSIYLDQNYLDEEINAQLELETYFPNSSSFFIELEGLPTGYYRIFYDLDTGERLWDNLYIDPSASAFNELIDEVSGDW
jgi:hypothetical protein